MQDLIDALTAFYINRTDPSEKTIGTVRELIKLRTFVAKEFQAYVKTIEMTGVDECLSPIAILFFLQKSWTELQDTDTLLSIESVPAISCEKLKIPAELLDAFEISFSNVFPYKEIVKVEVKEDYDFSDIKFSFS